MSRIASTSFSRTATGSSKSKGSAGTPGLLLQHNRLAAADRFHVADEGLARSNPPGRADADPAVLRAAVHVDDEPHRAVAGMPLEDPVQFPERVPPYVDARHQDLDFTNGLVPHDVEKDELSRHDFTGL